jgi:hypothetical protein
MFRKALAANPGIGPSVLSSPFMKTVCQSQIMPPAPTGSAVSAGLSAEDDFELGGEFLDVFARASERLAGFAVGCVAIVIVWLVSSFI